MTKERHRACRDISAYAVEGPSPEIGCITGALRIDICDDIMTKIGKPRGLINYCTLTDDPLERGGGASVPVLMRAIRARTIQYSVLWGAICWRASRL